MSNYIEASKAYVQDLLSKSEELELYYHNWEHTSHVHQTVIEIANGSEGVDEASLEALQLAALFHDVAYLDGWEGHEQRGAEMAEEFLSKMEYPTAQIDLIKQLIMATQMGRNPENLLEEIMVDADMSHIHDDQYIATTHKQLGREVIAKHRPQLTDSEWRSMSIEFMKKQKFYTDYAKTHFQEGKDKNMLKLENSPVKSDKPKRKKGRKKNVDVPDRGIETVFRVTLRNHVNLSRIADNKANTLISVNAIIISVVLSALFPKLDSNPYLIYPGITMLIVCVATIILSIMSTIPKTTHGHLSREEVERKKGNLIFFGNFHKMDLEDYEWAMQELMKDRDYLYSTLTRDLFFLGKVLNKKYSLLRYSYWVFIIGLILTIILFVISIQDALG